MDKYLSFTDDISSRRITATCLCCRSEMVMTSKAKKGATITCGSCLSVYELGQKISSVKTFKIEHIKSNIDTIEFRPTVDWYCPICRAENEVDHIKIGDHVQCTHCKRVFLLDRENEDSEFLSFKFSQIE